MLKKHVTAVLLKPITTYSLKGSAAQNSPQNMGLQLAVLGQGKHTKVSKSFTRTR